MNRKPVNLYGWLAGRANKELYKKLKKIDLDSSSSIKMSKNWYKLKRARSLVLLNTCKNQFFSL